MNSAVAVDDYEGRFCKGDDWVLKVKGEKLVNLLLLVSLLLGDSLEIFEEIFANIP